MDLDAEMEKLGIEHPRSPTAEELSDLIVEMDEPEPIMSQVSTDPIAGLAPTFDAGRGSKVWSHCLPVEVIDSAPVNSLSALAWNWNSG